MKHFFSKSLVCGTASVMLFLAGTFSAAAADKAVVVIGKDGSQHEVLLNAVSRIEVGTEYITLHEAEGNSTQHAISDIDRIMVGTESTSIKEIVSKGNVAVWPTVTDGLVNVAGATAGAEVKVYDLNGALVQSATASEGNATINLSGAKSGMYVVSVAGNTVKIIKK